MSKWSLALCRATQFCEDLPKLGGLPGHVMEPQAASSQTHSASFLSSRPGSGTRHPPLRSRRAIWTDVEVPTREGLHVSRVGRPEANPRDFPGSEGRMAF
jgi:hypothetical protein